MKSKFKVRKALDLLTDGKIEGVADQIRSVKRFSQAQLKDFADLFDQTRPFTFGDQYKLILVKRGAGYPNLRPKYAKERAYYFGFEIRQLMNKAAISSKKLTRKEAINKIFEQIGPTEYGEIPSVKTLERDYDYYRLVMKINKASHIIRIWPPLIKKKSSTIT